MAPAQLGAWVDTSSHKQGDKDRTPKTWTMELGWGVRLVVTRHIHAKPDDWLYYLSPFTSERVSPHKDIDAAKAHAVAWARETLGQIHGNLGPGEEAPATAAARDVLARMLRSCEQSLDDSQYAGAMPDALRGRLEEVARALRVVLDAMGKGEPAPNLFGYPVTYIDIAEGPIPPPTFGRLEDL